MLLISWQKRSLERVFLVRNGGVCYSLRTPIIVLMELRTRRRDCSDNLGFSFLRKFTWNRICNLAIARMSFALILEWRLLYQTRINLCMTCGSRVVFVVKQKMVDAG